VVGCVAPPSGTKTGGAQGELETTDGYVLNVAGRVSGPGGMAVGRGAVTLSAPDNSVGSLQVTGGTVNTAGNDVAVSDHVSLGKVRYSAGPGKTLAVRGSDLLDEADLTVDGGTLTIGPATLIDGFGNGRNWTRNANNAAAALGVPAIADGTATLTTTSGWQATSIFHDTPQDITRFRAQFDYADVSTLGADGISFTLHNDPRGVYARGSTGHNRGYGGQHEGIDDSVAVLFNLWQGSGIWLGTDGVAPSGGAANHDPTGDVDLRSGHPIRTTLDYDHATSTLSLALLDLTTGDAFEKAYTVDVPTVVGDTTAHVGFTGGTGGGFALQTISNFSFSAAGPLATTVADEGTNIVVAGNTNITTAAQQVTLGNLTLQNGVAAVRLSNAVYRFDDVTGDAATILGDLSVRGVLTPGESLGTLSVDGDLTLEAGSIYRWELGQAGADVVHVDHGHLLLPHGWKLELHALGDRIVQAGEQLELFRFGNNGYLAPESDLAMDWPEAMVFVGDGWDSTSPNWSPTFHADDDAVYLSGVVTVPEPSGVFLLGIGVVGILACAVRRRKRSSRSRGSDA